MIMRYARWGLLGAILSLPISQLAYAVDCETAVTLGDKPSMDGYADYSDFLVAIMDYKARARDLEAQQSACPELFAKQLSPESMDPTITRGPETLESAVERTPKIKETAQSGLHPSDGRSTSRTFKLPVLATTKLESETIPTPLRTLIDGNRSERDQQLVLNLLGPLPDDDGEWAVNIMERQYRDVLSQQDKSVEVAIENTQINDVITIESDDGDRITLYIKDNSLVHVDMLSHSCLGSC